MDRRSWLWRRKSSEKSPGETESSGSLSSYSERFFDDQEASRVSPNHTLSPEVSSNMTGGEIHDSVKSLSEKLSAALLNIGAKEELVKQHAKVAEEAVSGWEKAETEVVVLKQQLEAASQKNSALETRASHLDDALKECVRQLRQAREEQDQKVQNALIKKSQEWELAKIEFANRLAELQTKLQAVTTNQELHLNLEKENSGLKLELHTRAEELEIVTRAAEMASKQHLDSIKKVAKLESECRRLRAVARKPFPANDYKPVTTSSFYVDSLTDSQSDSGERLLAVDIDARKMGGSECEPSCSDSWASALIAELDQFKNEKTISANFTSSSLEIELMDDFLEMERLAALPENELENYILNSKGILHRADSRKSPLKADFEDMLRKTTELEEKVEKLEAEKARLEMALAESEGRLEASQSRLMEAEEKFVDLQRALASAKELKQVANVEVESSNAKRMAAESELQRFTTKMGLLEVELEKEQALSAEIAKKCQNLEDELSRKKRQAEVRRTVTTSNGELKLKQEKELAVAAGKLADCQKTIASLGHQLKSLATLEDFLPEFEKSELEGELKKPYFTDTQICKKDAISSKTVDISDPPKNILGELPPSLSSSLVNRDSEKSRNGFGKLFTRSRGSNRSENQ